ncbi:PRC-barrel domain-containing protein [Limnoglobus roseus]|uniref:PRC-barrel domain containing protein n=1 Tax=Limnoglobus roseus TaxID=2598579 RepID=A0A5C1A787_9BACT|nr:PRC-barrel domain-containing protein [Limnoglobus roseus]QEL13826.1 PRC-barrel domain containing protein [Limnoglobus roseus]
MTNNLLRRSLATACVMVMAATASAVDPVGTYRAKEVLGTKIMIGTTSVGTVDDIVFDDAGNLEYLIVDNGGKLTTVPWEAAKFDVARREAILTITPQQYQAIPTYTVKTYPSFYTPAYRTEVYKYYGVTPRELRRIERIRR